MAKNGCFGTKIESIEKRFGPNDTRPTQISGTRICVNAEACLLQKNACSGCVQGVTLVAVFASFSAVMARSNLRSEMPTASLDWPEPMVSAFDVTSSSASFHLST